MTGEQQTDARPDSCGGWGCLLSVAGVVLGLLAEAEAGAFISNAWSYCMNIAWPAAYDIADSPRFYLLTDLPLIAAYCGAFPLGFLLARRFLARSRRRLVRVLTGSLAGLLVLSAVMTGDLVYNVAPPDGKYLSARCPHGRPPWWPKPLPLRDSPFTDFEHQGWRGMFIRRPRCRCGGDAMTRVMRGVGSAAQAPPTKPQPNRSRRSALEPAANARSFPS